VSDAAKKSKLVWRRRLVYALIALVSVSILGRVYYESTRPELSSQASGSPGGGGAAFLPGDPGGTTGDGTAQAAAEPGTTEWLLPYLTEGGIATLLGIALGVATRAVAKLALIGLAVLFVAIQFLVHKGVIDNVDWGAFAALLRDFVLNVSSDRGLGAILQHKLPAAGGLMAGFYIGTRRPK
jgi:uncharacterized membrane protein (Fun14 family)